MPLAFRNLNITPDAPVATWPTEAVLTALERGDLDDLRRVASEVRRDPWGPIARRVEVVLTYSRPYGIAEIFDRIVARARNEAEAAERAEVAAEVCDALERSGLSRAAFAERVGTSTSRLSTYATGKVVPSATLLLRMRRLAETGVASTVRGLGPEALHQ